MIRVRVLTRQGDDDIVSGPTIPEAAKKLGIGRNTAYEAAHRGQIPTIKIGKRLLVPREALERQLAQAKVKMDSGLDGEG